MNETTCSWFPIEVTKSNWRVERYTVEIRVRGERTINEIRSSARVNQGQDRIGNTRECYKDNERGVQMGFDRSEEVGY